MHLIRQIILLLFFSLIALGGQAQGLNTDFGHTQQQFNVHKWNYISSDNFDAYYYGKSNKLAEVSLLIGETELKELEMTVDYRMGGRSQILIYETPEDLRNSNLFQHDKPFNPGGYTYTIQNKVLVAYTGNKRELVRQIRYGLAELLVSELMYGGSFQERIQSNTLLYLPEWYYKGLLKYLAEGWNSEVDSRVKDAFSRKAFHRFNLMDKETEILAGHSWWYFIRETYGQRAISDILYLTRVSKGYNNALLFTLGARKNEVFSDWIDFFELRYSKDMGQVPFRSSIPLPLHFKPESIRQMKLSPDGKHIAYGVSANGKKEIWLYSTDTKKYKRIYKNGYNQFVPLTEIMPTLAWSDQSLHVISKEKGKLIWKELNLQGKVLRKKTLNGLQGCSWIDIHPKAKQILISGYAKGRSDLFLFDIASERLVAINSDPYDDLYGTWTDDGEGILFSSNRSNQALNADGDSLITGSDSAALDIYMIAYPYNGRIKRLTNTPYLSEIQAQDYGTEGVAYLSDNNGIYNVYITKLTTEFDHATVVLLDSNNHAIDTLKLTAPVRVDSLKLDDLNLTPEQQLKASGAHGSNQFKDTYRHYPMSNHVRNTEILDLNIRLEKEIELTLFTGQYYLVDLPLSKDIEEDAKYNKIQPTVYRKESGYQVFFSDSSVNTFLVRSEKKEKSATPIKDSTLTIRKLDTGKYTFNTGFPYVPPGKKEPITDKEITYNTTSRAYHLNFFPNYLATQLLDNSIIGTPYQMNTVYADAFNNYNRYYGRVEIGFSDLFKDHSIQAGGRIPLSLIGTDFYGSYENKKRNIDWGLSGFRQSRLAGNVDLFRAFIHEFRVHATQPLGKGWSFRSSVFFRQDRNLQISTDQASLTQNQSVNDWIGSKFELLLNRSFDEDLNFPIGFKGKVYTEIFQNTVDQNQSVYISGLDLRYYKKLHKKILWTNRLAGAYSYGPSKNLYLLGGVENWIRRGFDGSLGISPDYMYSLQSITTGVRGFPINIRNGGNYLVFNSEIRLPITRYLMKAPISNDFFRNLQTVLFYDIGSAWNGLSPFQEQHYNTRVFDQGSVTIKVRNKNNPFVSGFGAGVRSRLLGYYLRADLAWGLENGSLVNAGKPQWYIGLGFDF